MLLIGYELNVSINYLRLKAEERKTEEQEANKAGNDMPFTEK